MMTSQKLFGTGQSMAHRAAPPNGGAAEPRGPHVRPRPERLAFVVRGGMGGRINIKHKRARKPY